MMARRWNGILATQTAPFRGTSTIVIAQTAGYPMFRHITDARYTAVVSGGISGSFAVLVTGLVGTTAYTIAGMTNISTARNAVLFPAGYTSSGGTIDSLATARIATDLHRLDLICPPYSVQFQSNVATAGISASISVEALIVEGD